MSNLEKDLVGKNSRIVKLYHFKPIETESDGVMTILTEGSRAIVDESQLTALTNDEGKPLFRIWKTNTVKVSDYISTIELIDALYYSRACSIIQGLEIISIFSNQQI